VNNRTLAILKPEVVKENKIGSMIRIINDNGFKIINLKMIKLSEDSAKGFYEIHKDKPFYKDLVEYMTSGPCIPLILEKDNAVTDYRKLIGATDPVKAAEGTIRKLYAKDKTVNAVHGSDSDDNAKLEISHFFTRDEILGLCQ
jgi:nucleoside-diphosphate kinase